MQPASTKFTCRVGVPSGSLAATLETAASKLAEAELNAEPSPRRSLKEASRASEAAGSYEAGEVVCVTGSATPGPRSSPECHHARIKHAFQIFVVN